MSERLNNPDLDVAGILVTNCRNTNNASIWLEGIEMLAKEYEIKVYGTKIHQNVAVEESQTLNQSLFEYAPTARATRKLLEPCAMASPIRKSLSRIYTGA